MSSIEYEVKYVVARICIRKKGKGKEIKYERAQESGDGVRMAEDGEKEDGGSVKGEALGLPDRYLKRSICLFLRICRADRPAALVLVILLLLGRET